MGVAAAVVARPASYALACGRGLALGLLALPGPVVLLVSSLVAMAGYLPAILAARRFTALTRHGVARWCGIPVPSPYREPPEPPRPNAQGQYRYGNRLYDSPRLVAWQRRLTWLSNDPATRRDSVFLLAAPVVAVTALLPSALVVAGIALSWHSPWTLAAVPAGLLCGPPGLRLYGRWSARLLGPAAGHGRASLSRALWTRVVALIELVAVALFAVPGVVLTAVVLVSLLPGAWALPWAQRLVRPAVTAQRPLVARWARTELTEPYLPPPDPPRPRRDGLYVLGRTLFDSAAPVVRAQRYRWVLRDPATWRDLVWLALQPVTGAGAALLVAAAAYGAFGLVWPWLWLLPTQWWLDYDPAAAWTALGAPGPSWWGPVAGSVMTVAALLLAPHALHGYGRAGAALLGPTGAASLAWQVRRLSDSRDDATRAQVAELRRIEQDLHDGVQAGLVALGMQLDTAEALVDNAPNRAKELLADARGRLAGTLADLRTVVRTIHPPVLAERGLADAVRALALDSPLDVTVTVDYPGRAEAAVESAVYFALRELLTNVAKHSGAHAAALDVRFEAGLLHASVQDAGNGGVDPDRGTGLNAMRRRLAVFDGDVTVDSPPGGPTVVSLCVPCESWQDR
ncbi:Signal transduction histidine kinase [Prauserella aidingensis]|uniref:sensor histidine kinase n=1 Tax=Prauserella aidingensis TaxID=387890 RepID=UPI0020A35787|nr:histidine kinase [Prauserella aidingensis]MCP2253996.1 Signal transduction histidine kinase [Prauserella aidingensis]